MAKSKSVPAAAPVAGINQALLVQVAAETAKPGGYMHVSEADAAPLVAAGLIEVNPDATFANAQGHKAARATTAGLAAAGATPAAAAAPAAPKPVFKVVSGITMPDAGKRGAIRGEKYPFSTLNVGDAFFMPATVEQPQPERAYASTLASARARYASNDPSGAMRKNRKGVMVPVQVYERDFAIRGNVDGASFGQPGVKGAAIWRTK